VTSHSRSTLSRAATITCITPFTPHLRSTHKMAKSRTVTTVVPLLENGIDASPSGQIDAPVISCRLPPNSDAANKSKNAVYNDRPWHPMYEYRFPQTHPYIGSRYGRFDTPLQPSHSRQIHVQCRTDNVKTSKATDTQLLRSKNRATSHVYQHLSVQQ
jgi:hypothetical protein